MDWEKAKAIMEAVENKKGAFLYNYKYQGGFCFHTKQQPLVTFIDL